jgi:S-adenosylmethionine hydrolase
VHVAVVDPGVGTSRAVAIVEADGHVLIAPDNGLLSELVERASQPILRHLDMAMLGALRIDRLSATFHGRDLFAPLAGELAAGRITPARLGRVIGKLPVKRVRTPPVIAPASVQGTVITIDRFGNLITDIEGECVARLASPKVRVGTLVCPLVRTYAEAAPGSYLGLINAFGVLEIALRNGSAAEGLSLERGAVVAVEGDPSNVSS